MGWKTIIIGSECKVSLTMNRMKISIGDEFQNISLCDIDTVIFSHNKLVITIPLLSKLIENNINVIICDERNDPVGVFQSFNTQSLVFKRLKEQLEWKITRKKKLWKVIIEDKIQSEIDVLTLNKTAEDKIKQLRIYKNSVYNDDQTNREAAAARYYYSLLFGAGFTRDDDSQINYALNYGYKILASYISKCIVSRGLITQLGIHHIGESNPFNLTYDFIEPLRSIIDIWVKENVDDKFNTFLKTELIGIMQFKVSIDGKWNRLSDAIEIIIDSYIGFLNEKRNNILRIDISKGFKEE